jgi:Nif-specific regulatory protein
MVPSWQADKINAGKTGARLLPELIRLSIEIGSESEFANLAASTINSATGAEVTAILRGSKGRWRTVAAAPRANANRGWPAELLSNVLDEESVQSDDSWIAAPVVQPNPGGEVLLQKIQAEDRVNFESIAAAMGLALDSHKRLASETRRSSRLEAILEVTAHWNQSRETDQLLTEIAEASTRLLGAERATIFLPTKNGTQLIGRPALGVEGGELKIPANTGVVGKVIASGEAIRVDQDIAGEQAQINRSVDEQLNFETRSLLCVPLINSAGKTIGAFELINKTTGNFTDADTIDLSELAAHAAGAIETTQHVEKLVTTRKNVAQQAAGQVNLIGQCAEIQKLKATVQRVANTDIAILILGENGTGKEVVAQMIHYLSNRSDQVLVAVNCAAITETLLESELFGHEKGAFTDAHQAREGKFELADGGTLFLDEIGDMSLGGQAKLLRVLEEKTIVRVGGSTPIATDARVIAATNQNLAELVTAKKFREDLFFRLNVLTLQLPPLRDRGDDVIQLAEHFSTEFCIKARREPLQLSASAKKKLLHHNWPGNVRELRNMMERLAYMFQGNRVEAEDLEFIISPRKANASVFDMDLPLTDATKSFQRQYIQRHIDRAGGNMTDAAERLGLHRSNLYRKMRQLDMDGADEEN